MTSSVSEASSSGDVLRTVHMLANIADQLQRSINEQRDMGRLMCFPYNKLVSKLF